MEHVNNIAQVLSERLDKLIRESGKTQRAISKESGLTGSLISNLRNGTGHNAANRMPRINVLITLAKYFNCSLDYLVGLSDGKTLDPTLKAAAEYTGLSEDATEGLHALQLLSEADFTSNEEFIRNMPGNALKILRFWDLLIKHGPMVNTFIAMASEYIYYVEELAQLRVYHSDLPADEILFAQLLDQTLSVPGLSPREKQNLHTNLGYQIRAMNALPSSLLECLHKIATEEVTAGTNTSPVSQTTEKKKEE